MIIDLDGHLIDKHTRELSQRSKLFSPLLIPTLAKSHNEVSLLTNFSDLKSDCRFIYPFGRQECTATFKMLVAILVVIQGWSTKVPRDVIFTSFLYFKFEREFRYSFER